MSICIYGRRLTTTCISTSPEPNAPFWPAKTLHPRDAHTCRQNTQSKINLIATLLRDRTEVSGDNVLARPGLNLQGYFQAIALLVARQHPQTRMSLFMSLPFSLLPVFLPFSTVSLSLLGSEPSPPQPQQAVWISAGSWEKGVLSLEEDWGLHQGFKKKKTNISLFPPV